MQSFIRFEDVTPIGRKTKVEWVVAQSSDSILGTISWFGRWRQYTFSPASDTTFSVGCMEDINKEIKRLMAERRTNLSTSTVSR